MDKLTTTFVHVYCRTITNRFKLLSMCLTYLRISRGLPGEESDENTHVDRGAEKEYRYSANVLDRCGADH